MRIETITLLSLLTTVTGCDFEDSIGVNTVGWRTTPGHDPMLDASGCILVSEGLGGAGGGGGGPDYYEESESGDGEIPFLYYIATEEHAGKVDFVTPENSELAAELSADIEFYRSGARKTVEFETYDGILFQFIHWGTPDCEDAHTDQPRPG